MACREHDLSKIARIEAIALSKVPAIDGMSASMFALTSNMYVASSKLPMSGNIGATTPTRITFTKDSAKLSDKDSTGVYGYSHSITFKWKWQPNTSAEFDSLMTMRRAPHCLRITYFGGTVRYVLTEQDGYLFSWNDNDGNCECEMKLTNVMGFLRVLEDSSIAKKYSLSLSADPSEGGIVTGGGNYSENSSVTVQATPLSNFKFLQWSDGGAQSHNVTMNEDKSLVATFQEKNKYSLTLNVSPSGAGSVSGGGSYNEGDTATVYAFPNSNYRFVSWSDGGAQAHSVSMTGNKTLTATFEATRVLKSLSPGTYTKDQVANIIPQIFSNANANLLVSTRKKSGAEMKAKYPDFTGDYATVYSSTYTIDGTDYLMTCISDSGTVYSATEMNSYWDTIKGNVKTLDASTRKLFIGSYPNDGSHTTSDLYANALHYLHDIYYGTATIIPSGFESIKYYEDV